MPKAPKVRDVMRRGSATVDAHASLVEASEMLRALQVGALAISTQTLITGFITDREIVNAIAEGRDPSSVEVAELAGEMPTVDASEDVAEVRRHIESSGASGAVVLDQGRPVGVVTDVDLRGAARRSNEPVMHAFRARRAVIRATMEVSSRADRKVEIVLGRKPYRRRVAIGRVAVLSLGLVAVLFLLATLLLMALDGDVTPLVATAVMPILAVAIPLGLRAAHGRWVQQ
ncbi:cyclic nucleotide-binding/CBS domain-containing protein [Streptomyces sp. NPDC058469]|uniref:CBS domain-containing protein n=1 Tax=Streptomyces sp. NPDC058469 TaxID=3346514 RepID=UPI00365ADC88